jgi:hypothetical protein
MQRFFFLSFLLLVFSIRTFAQEPKSKPPVKKDSVNSYIPEMIQNEEVNRIYVDCNNLFHYKGMSGRKLIGKMGERVVEQLNGFFIINVPQVGKYALSIYDASTTSPQLLEEKKFEAVDMPDPFVSVTGKSCGFISRKELLSADSVSVKSKKQNGNTILSFKLILVNGKIGRKELEAKNNKLTHEMKQSVRGAVTGTTVIFEYVRALIKAKGAGITISLPSISFILED